MRESKHCLSFKEALKLLSQKSFSDFESISSRTSLYNSNMGILYFRSSKDYKYPHKNFWYSINPYYVIDNKIDFIVLIAGYEGIFIIPKNYFLDYREKFPVGHVKGGREDFTILKKDGNYYRNEPKNETDNITDFFVPIEY